MVYFGPRHLALYRETKVATGKGDTFGIAAAASTIHGITPYSLSGAAMGTEHGDPTMTLINKLDDHLDSLASIATNINIVLEQLTTTTTTQ